MKFLPIDHNAFECTESQAPSPHKKWLGFPTGIPARQFRGINTVHLKQSTGLLINAAAAPALSTPVSAPALSTPVPWPIERFVEHNEKIIAIGPWLEDSHCLQLPDLHADTPLPTSHTQLTRLLPAIRAVSNRNFELKAFFPWAFREYSQSGILVYPLNLAETMREFNMEHSDVEPWIHPDYSGEPAWSFFLGVLAWKFLTGMDPFHKDSGELRRERIRRGILPPITAFRNNINPRLADLVTRSLRADDNVPSLNDWFDMSDLWHAEFLKPVVQAQPAVASPAATEPQHVKKQATASHQPATSQRLKKAEAKRIEKSFQLRLWWRKWIGWVAGSATVFILLLSIFSSPVKKFIDGPVTLGLSPKEITKIYYKAMDKMDLITMSDSLARGIGKEDLRLVEMLYVTSRVRQGMEQKEVLRPASDWIDSGSPVLADDVSVWGITDLSVNEISETRIEASYILWFPAGMEARGGNSSIARTDTLKFSRGRRAWEISGIDRTTSK